MAPIPDLTDGNSAEKSPTVPSSERNDALVPLQASEKTLQRVKRKCSIEDSIAYGGKFFRLSNEAHVRIFSPGGLVDDPWENRPFHVVVEEVEAQIVRERKRMGKARSCLRHSDLTKGLVSNKIYQVDKEVYDIIFGSGGLSEDPNVTDRPFEEVLEEVETRVELERQQQKYQETNTANGCSEMKVFIDRQKIIASFQQRKCCKCNKLDERKEGKELAAKIERSTDIESEVEDSCSSVEESIEVESDEASEGEDLCSITSAIDESADAESDEASEGEDLCSNTSAIDDSADAESEEASETEDLCSFTVAIEDSTDADSDEASDTEDLCSFTVAIEESTDADSDEASEGKDLYSLTANVEGSADADSEESSVKEELHANVNLGSLDDVNGYDNNVLGVTAIAPIEPNGENVEFDGYFDFKDTIVLPEQNVDISIC